MPRSVLSKVTSAVRFPAIVIVVSAIWVFSFSVSAFVGATRKRFESRDSDIHAAPYRTNDVALHRSGPTVCSRNKDRLRKRERRRLNGLHRGDLDEDVNETRAFLAPCTRPPPRFPFRRWHGHPALRRWDQ